MTKVSAPVLLASALVAALAAADGPPSALAGLPQLARPRVAEAQPLPPLTTMAPGIHVSTAEHLVVLDGRIQMDQGPADGLEVVACLAGGKSHETNITLETGAAELVKAACIAALGMGDGWCPEQGKRQPARGIPLRITVRWNDLDDPKRAVELAASCLVRDRLVDRPYPPLPFVYTGSRFQPILVPGANGQTVQRQQFMLASTRTVVAVYDEPDALFAAPFPDSWRDHHFEAYSGASPPPGTLVRLVIAPAELPLTLTASDDGGLSAGGPALDDAALAALLAQRYGQGAQPALRAVGVRVAARHPSERDEALRSRLIAAAVLAKAWVVPVFILQP